ncbi:MAG: hypothetical protein JSR19_00805 [Proteobacteria bacterium]|nr:hypothetical protein [Pseudomonadota bacterium]HQR02979.1 hypothetical protein [Rhodocyclaceae bacterium]
MAFTTANIGLALNASADVRTAYQAVWDGLWQQRHLPPALLELARLRLAALHQAPREAALRPALAESTGLDAAKIESTLSGNWYKDAAFSAGERAVLAYTEVYAQDPEAISDELAADVLANYGEPGLVCLTEALGFIDGRIRLALMFSHLGGAR